MLGGVPLSKIEKIQTPFYYYNTDLLRKTLDSINKTIEKYPNFVVHYAVKANANKEILSIIAKNGLGADCVSGGEIEVALKSGFKAKDIVYAGVGKDDWEIEMALEKGIFCFNVESAAELAVINEIATRKSKIARVALRINPELDASTHEKITTGRAEDKFGLSMSEVMNVSELCKASSNINLVGLHFHIGSQITDLQDFVNLCARINTIMEKMREMSIKVENINVGGGLGISYTQPDLEDIPPFEEYFNVYATYLKVEPNQTVHFELGRSVVAQCGTLFSKVIYVKKGVNKDFVILNAGMTDLIRPAMYDSYHKIQNMSSKLELRQYDVVGPICESSDIFAKGTFLPLTKRGDLIAIRSAGAYGEVMSSTYNCRPMIKSYTSEQVENMK